MWINPRLFIARIQRFIRRFMEFILRYISLDLHICLYIVHTYIYTILQYLHTRDGCTYIEYICAYTRIYVEGKLGRPITYFVNWHWTDNSHVFEAKSNELLLSKDRKEIIMRIYRKPRSVLRKILSKTNWT